MESKKYGRKNIFPNGKISKVEKRERLVYFTELGCIIFVTFEELQSELLAFGHVHIQAIDTAYVCLFYDAIGILGMSDKVSRHIGMYFFVVRRSKKRVTGIEDMPGDFLYRKALAPGFGQYSQYFALVVHGHS